MITASWQIDFRDCFFARRDRASTYWYVKKAPNREGTRTTRYVGVATPKLNAVIRILRAMKEAANERRKLTQPNPKASSVKEAREHRKPASISHPGKCSARCTETGPKGRALAWVADKWNSSENRIAFGDDTPMRPLKEEPAEVGACLPTWPVNAILKGSPILFSRGVVRAEHAIYDYVRLSGGRNLGGPHKDKSTIFPFIRLRLARLGAHPPKVHARRSFDRLILEQQRVNSLKLAKSNSFCCPEEILPQKVRLDHASANDGTPHILRRKHLQTWPPPPEGIKAIDDSAQAFPL